MNMQTIFLIILGVISAVYLVALWAKKQGIFQGILKACLVPLVAAVYITGRLSGANEIYLLVLLALVFGWLGDIFLIKISDTKFFMMGLASFLIGHICYIPAMLHYTSALQIVPLVISIAVAIPLGIAIRKFVRPSKEMSIPALAYEAVILVMVIFALQLFLGAGTSAGTLVFAGALCFLVSDTMLALFTFHTMPRYGNFLVMLTYISAQLLIVLGLSGF